ncbi:hypothetical protein BYT27DRAFT_7212992 [Phlegmacium glaucopus]|nr:hypothetical protein BYT27DRAFT_7212992 [Phlegmacium glaucopus]
MVNQREKTKKAKKTPSLSKATAGTKSFPPKLTLKLSKPNLPPVSTVEGAASETDSVRITPPPPIPAKQLRKAVKNAVTMLGKHGKQLPVSTVEGAASETDSVRITPPPPIPAKQLRKAVKKAVTTMLGKHGKQMSEAPTIATIEEEEDHFESPDEGTSKKRRRIFEDGYNDADEEDELEGDKEEEILEDEDQDTISDDSSSSEDTIQHESPIVQKKNNKKAVSDLVPFKLNFAIPLNGADEIVSLLSNISWKDFRSQLADTLGIAPKSVAVAYRFSTSPTSARYVHLKSTEHLTELFQTAKKTLKTSRSQKPFYVTIKDLRDEPGKKGKQSKGRKNKKVRQ